VFRAIHDGKPDQGLLAYQYLQTLPQIAQGDANKMWIVPSEFSKALEGLSKLGGADGEARSWLDVPEPAGAPGSERIDTSGWFESQLPPAAEQPEARIELTTTEPGLPATTSLARAAQDATREDGAPPA
jgi:hypothetical protein